MSNLFPTNHYPQPFSPEYVMETFVDDSKGIKESELIVHIDGVDLPVYLNSQRYLLFKRDGLKCAHCDRVASVCFLAKPPKNSKAIRGHFNFFSVEPDGRFVLFTKDHKIAKSTGGRDVMANYIPMCQSCNTKKGSKVNVVDLEEAIRNGTAVDLSAETSFDIKIPGKIIGNTHAMTIVHEWCVMMKTSMEPIEDKDHLYKITPTHHLKFAKRSLKELCMLLHNTITIK